MYPTKAMLEYAEIAKRRHSKMPPVSQEEFTKQALRQNPHLRKRFDNSLGYSDKESRRPQMLQVTEKLLQEMTNLIVGEVKPQKIILFGSHARGTARADSDLDFIVVEDGPFNAQRSRRAEMTRLRSILFDYFIPMDFLVFTQQEIEEWKDVKNHVVFHALREGRTLYESH